MRSSRIPECLLAFAVCWTLGVGLPTHAQTPQTQPAITSPAALTYVGAFRLPDGYGLAKPVLAVKGDKLFVGREEFTIPEPLGTGTTASSLPTATKTGTTIAHPNLGLVNPSSQNQKILGGVFPVSDGYVVTAYDYYDGGGTQATSHFKVTMDGSISGPFKVGASAGFVAGYMGAIPPEWQSLFGGSAFTGQCCIPIIYRTSLGPAISVFNPANVGTLRGTVPATQVVGYPINTPTLGTCESSGKLFNCTATMGGVVFPAGTRSVLFFGTTGDGPYCYGVPVNTPALHGTVWPGDGVTTQCFTQAPQGKGPYSDPYNYRVFSYDANDLLAVKNGRKRPSSLVPVSWTFTLPFQNPTRSITGAAYDPVRQWIFLATYATNDLDNWAPLIQVLEVNASGKAPVTAPSPKGTAP